MRIYLTFFQIYLFLSTLATAHAEAFHKVYKSATELTLEEQIVLANKIMLNVLASENHKSVFRAGCARSELDNLIRTATSIVYPSADTAQTPSQEEKESPDMITYGGSADTPVLFMHEQYADQRHAIYIYTNLNLKITPMDLGGKKLPNGILSEIDLIEQNKENIKKIIVNGQRFYLGRVNPKSPRSKQNLHKRMQQHARDVRQIFPNRKADAIQMGFEHEAPMFVQPLFINMHPDDVNIIEGYLIHFFGWDPLWNSIRGLTTKKGEETSPFVSRRLTDLHNKLVKETRIAAVNLRAKFETAADEEPKKKPRKRRSSILIDTPVKRLQIHE